MIDFFNGELERTNGDKSLVSNDSKRIAWSRGLKNRISRRSRIEHVDAYAPASYRPFCNMWTYTESSIIEYPSQQLLFHPDGLPSPVIATSGNRGFSCLMAQFISDKHFVSDSQCFPLYWYEKVEDDKLFSAGEGEKVVKDAWGGRCVRHDAITDRTLEVFRAAYPAAYATRAKSRGGAGLTKEDILYYVYGILHSPTYRERYAANLAKELPRIPLTRHFEEFANAGRELARLHLHYEELEPWPTVSADILPGVDPGRVEKIRWAKRKDPETGRRVDDHTRFVYNQNVTITGIPEEAQGYVVNGRSPLDWVIDRYQVKTDKKSGITNDPNDYSDDPWYIIDLIVRLVRVSMETQAIVAALPTSIDEIDHPPTGPQSGRRRRHRPWYGS